MNDKQNPNVTSVLPEAIPPAIDTSNTDLIGNFNRSLNSLLWKAEHDNQLLDGAVDSLISNQKVKELLETKMHGSRLVRGLTKAGYVVAGGVITLVSSKMIGWFFKVETTTEIPLQQIAPLGKLKAV